jgi:hypothetical protein
MSNYLDTVIASGISGSYTALQNLQNETNQGAVIDLQLNQELSKLTQAEIKAQLSFTLGQAQNQRNEGWCQMAGEIAQGVTSLGGLMLGTYMSPAAPVEPESMSVNMEEEAPVSTGVAKEEAAVEGSNALPLAEESAPAQATDREGVQRADIKADQEIKAQSGEATVEAKNAQEKSAANTNEETETEEQKATKAQAKLDHQKAVDTWQNQVSSITMRYNTMGTASGQLCHAFTAPFASYQTAASTEKQGYATVATGGLQNIQTAQNTINSALEQQRGQASAAAQAEISIIQAGHPIAG